MQDERSLEERTVQKVTRRLLPFLFILYVIAFPDRVNFGYAALGMNGALGLSAEVFGTLGGFIGPSLMGFLMKATGSTDAGFVAIGACLILCGLLTLAVRNTRRIES